METKFTKGEWVYVGGDNGSCEINIGETTTSVCRWDKNTGVNVISREEMEANAKLIAAAPELLEALIEYKRMYEEIQPAGGWQGVYEIGNYAIKKAIS